MINIITHNEFGSKHWVSAVRKLSSESDFNLASFCNLFVVFSKLAGRTLFITGASRGIGKAIALKAAKDGANVVVAAKTAEPHPKLPGTIYTTAEESKHSQTLL